MSRPFEFNDYYADELRAAPSGAEGRAATENTPRAIRRPSPTGHTLENDEARLAALDDACGVNED